MLKEVRLAKDTRDRRCIGSRNSLTQSALNNLATLRKSGELMIEERIIKLLNSDRLSPELEFKILCKLLDFTNNPSYISEEALHSPAVLSSKDKGDLLRALSKKLSKGD